MKSPITHAPVATKPLLATASVVKTFTQTQTSAEQSTRSFPQSSSPIGVRALTKAFSFSTVWLALAFVTVSLSTTLRASAQNQEKSNGTVETQDNTSLISSIHRAATALHSDTAQPHNSQLTFTPARFDAKAFRQYLRYPAGALQQNQQARVELIVFLNNRGEITNLNFQTEQQNTSEQSINAFVEAAFAAVQHCTFTPALHNNKPVNSVVKIPIRFVL